MAITLVPEDGTGLPNANVYLDESDASARADLRLDGAAFVAAIAAADDTTDTARRAMLMATQQLDLIEWDGWQLNAGTQRLAFPRDGLYDRDDNALPPSPLPEFLLESFIDLSILLFTDASALGDNALAGFEALTVGPISLTTRTSKVTTVQLPITVLRRVAPFRRTAGLGESQVRLVRG